MIDTSESLNLNNYVQWVPVHVRISNNQPSLFLANGITRWQNSIVDLTRQGVRVRAISEDETYKIVDQQGREWNEVPATIDMRFLAAALRLAEIGLEGVRWEFDEDSLVLIGKDDESLRNVPLRGGQHLAVNWFSAWRTLYEEPHVAEVLQGADDDEWTFLGIARNLEQWCDEVEAGVENAVVPFRSWAYSNDLYNPSVSIAEVLILYDAFLYAEEKQFSKVTALIRDLFVQFSDAYILVGPTDPLLQDLGPTPFGHGITPRVAVHGNLLKTILDQRHLQFLPQPYVAALVFFLTLAVMLSLTGFNTGTHWRWLVAPFILVSFVLFVVLLFSLKDIVVPVVAPLSSGIAATMFVVGLRLWKEESQRLRIRRLFGTYVAPDVVDLMVEAEEDPKLGGNERVITAFFSDIVSFTSISEQLSAAEVVELINIYVEEMTALLVREKGTLDKYIGDAIVGIFNAPHDLPDHASRACYTALAFSEAQRKLCINWSSGEKRFPALVCQMRTRIGLHSGLAVVGNMGSSQRFSYTMMGDCVNLAARLEQLGKVYGVDIIVSDTTRRDALEREPDFVFRLLDVTRVKGREAPVQIYELMGMKSHLSEQEERCIELFEEGYTAFEESDLLKAKELFLSASKLERRGDEMSPSQLYISRCNQMMDVPI